MGLRSQEIAFDFENRNRHLHRCSDSNCPAFKCARCGIKREGFNAFEFGLQRKKICMACYYVRKNRKKKIVNLAQESAFFDELPEFEDEEMEDTEDSDVRRDMIDDLLDDIERQT